MCFQVQIQVLRKEELIMVHQTIKEYGNVQILRKITSHSLNGIGLSENWAIIASFSEHIKITHKGKQLQVYILLVKNEFEINNISSQAYLHLMIRTVSGIRSMNVQFRLIRYNLVHGQRRNFVPKLECTVNIELK